MGYPRAMWSATLSTVFPSSLREQEATMARFSKAFTAVTGVLLLWVFGVASAQTQPIPVPDPPSVAAESYVLMDYHSGRVLAERNPGERRDPASITKLMTAYTVFKELEAGNISADDEVLVSERAWRAPGSRMFIEVGDRIRLEDLLRGMIIQSGNDASIALAEHVAGSEDTFAQVMNQYADALGMENTHYVNATGLPTRTTTPAPRIPRSSPVP
ncbi:MAG: serine hydrolase [Arhodomonas sp.]|nr:serine hydrolase [Arhodomonas sp.]